MSISSALAIASSGLANVNLQMSLLSQNVANAGTPDYAVEVSTPQSLAAFGQGIGIISGAVTRQINTELQNELFSQNSTVAGLQTRQTALQSIDAVQGTPGQGNDLNSLLANLQTQFSTLLTQPDVQAQQSKVVQAATTLAQGINALGSAYTTQRQAAQTDLVSAVGSLNQTLGQIGTLSDKIIALKAGGHDTADLENQRAAAIDTLSQLVAVKTFQQTNGDLVVTTASGAMLPTHGAANPLSAPDANLQPGDSYGGGTVPGVTLNGADITRQLQGGRIGADLTLRDSTLPTYQAELDEFAQGLASRFSGAGLSLFTDASGNVPAPGKSPPVQAPYVGFAAAIQVNPAVQATPSLVRDGNVTQPGLFTPNPNGGPAGFTTLINNVLTNALGNNALNGSAQPAFATTGLGADGSLNAPFAPPPTLAALATALVASQAQDSSETTNQLQAEQGIQSSLNSKLTAGSGVNMDAEMSSMITLQNAYSANARVIATVQSMFDRLLSAVQ